MQNYIITQEDKNIVNQNAKELFAKIELLNRDYKVIELLEGNLISDSFSITTESNVRRTYSMELEINDPSLLIGEDRKIWMDKYIRPYVGVRNLRTEEITWYIKGTFTMLDQSYSFDATTSTLSLSLSDLMSELNGDRNGSIIAASKVEEGAIVRDVIVTILQEAGIKKYILSDLEGLTIPHKIEFNSSETYYGMLNTIVELYSYFEMFFDMYGTFVIQKIPHQEAESVVLNKEFFAPLVIQESINTSFKEVYNKIKLYGQSLESDYTSSSCTYENNIYNATIEGVTSLDNFTKYAIQIPTLNQADAKININNIGALYITDDVGKYLPEGTLTTGYNVFKYRKTNNDLYWLGQYQVYAEAEETNSISPFHKSKIGEIVKICSGDDFDFIYSNSLAQNRANYELYHACRIQESISINMIDVPWLDVNWLIEYQSYTTKDIKRYVIKQISGSTTEGVIDVSMVAFYDQDPYS